MIKNITISILIVVFAAISAYNLYHQPANEPEDYLPLLNSVIGLLGVLLLVLRTGAHSGLFFLWVGLQLTTIVFMEPVEVTLYRDSEPLMTVSEINFIQGIGYQPEAMHLDLGEVILRPNLVPLVFMILLLIPVGHKKKRITYSALPKVYEEGETFELNLFRVNKTLGHLLPQKVKVVQSVDLSDNKNWLLVSLSKPLKFKSGRVIYNALIKPKDHRNFVKSNPRQLGYFRLLKDRKVLQNGCLDIKHTVFVDWVFVK